MRAIIEGPTPQGIAMAAEAAIGIECDVYENYNYIDNAPLNRPNTRIVTAGGYDGRMINDALRFESVQGDGLSNQGSYAV